MKSPLIAAIVGFGLLCSSTYALDQQKAQRPTGSQT